MRRSQRLIAATVLIALSGALGGCSTGMSNFDPSDLLDFLDTKKKLPGERKPVFPDGVPGLEQGVPKELYKGARQQQIVDPNAQATAAELARIIARRVTREDPIIASPIGLTAGMARIVDMAGVDRSNP